MDIALPVNFKHIKNILILRSEGSLGDAVLTSCYYREFKKVNPDVKISVAAFGSAYDYLRKIEYIDTVYRLPIKRVLRPNQKWPSIFIMGLKLRFKKFDFILDDNPKPQLNWSFFRFLLGKNKIIDTSILKKEPHTSQERTRMMLDAMGLNKAEIRYEIPLQQTSEQYLAELLQEKNITRYGVLNIFSSVADRSLNEINFQHIAASVKQYSSGLDIIIPVRGFQKKYIENLLADNSLDFIPFETKNIFDLFSVINASAFVISPDTAAVHIATGLGKKGIFFYSCGHTFCAAGILFAPQVVIKSADGDINNFSKEEFSEKYQKLISGGL